MLRDCFALACDKAGLPPSSLDAALSGDLLNQCVSSAFAMKDSGVPYLGLYGACSTMAEALGLAALRIDGAELRRSVCVPMRLFTSSPPFFARSVTVCPLFPKSRGAAGSNFFQKISGFRT